MVGCFSIINDEDVIYVPGVTRCTFGLYEGSDVDGSKCCRNISAIVPDMGDPIAIPLSGW
jgi:hypothetical protein